MRAGVRASAPKAEPSFVESVLSCASAFERPEGVLTSPDSTIPETSLTASFSISCQDRTHAWVMSVERLLVDEGTLGDVLSGDVLRRFLEEQRDHGGAYVCL